MLNDCYIKHWTINWNRMRHDYSACCTSINHIILLLEPVSQSGSHVADNWRLRDWQVSFRTLVWKPEGLGDLGPDPGGSTEGAVLRPLARWNCGLESRGDTDICLVNFVCCHVRSPCDGPIFRPEESYWVCVCVCVCMCVSLSSIKYNSNPLHLQRVRRLRSDKKIDLGVDGVITKTRLRKAI